MVDKSDGTFEMRWKEYTSVSFIDPERRKFRAYCDHAQRFSQWAEALIDEAVTKGSLPAIKMAKLLLLEKYFEWRSAVPKSHQNHTSARGGHICIYRVFVEAYLVLNNMDLSLSPPLIGNREPNVPQIHGLMLGEEEDG